MYKADGLEGVPEQQQTQGYRVECRSSADLSFRNIQYQFSADIFYTYLLPIECLQSLKFFEMVFQIK